MSRLGLPEKIMIGVFILTVIDAILMWFNMGIYIH
jgi:hypothetical protein